MTLVNASPEDIRRLAAALGTYKNEVVAAHKRVQGALNAAHWQDPQKDRFEARLQDFRQGVDTFVTGEVDEMVRSLNQLAARLTDIRQMRM